MEYGKMSKMEERLTFIGAVVVGLLLFVLLTQPVWNSKRMITNFDARCKAQHGIKYVNHGMFGDTHECLINLDKRILPTEEGR